MPSTFLGLNTGLSGLSYFQGALNTTSHNISNANTKGYSKQTIQANASDALRLNKSWGMMGTGITASGIERERSSFYDTKYWGANSKYTQYDTEYDNLSQLQTYMNEMTSDAGYTKWLSELSDALQDLSANPSDYTTRISFSLTADSVTDMVNELAHNFQNTQKTINDEIELAVSEINSLAKQIYELSQEIITIELKGGNANDLRDQRGVCIDKLSSYTDVDVQERTMMFGAGKEQVASDAETICIRINGQILVDEIGFNELMVVPREQPVNQNDVEGLVDIYWKCADGTSGQKFEATKTTGKLAGLFNIRDGNNAEVLSGTTTVANEAADPKPAFVELSLSSQLNVADAQIPTSGTITIKGREYSYSGWTPHADEDGNFSMVTLQNITMLDASGKTIPAVFPETGAIGEAVTIQNGTNSMGATTISANDAVTQSTAEIEVVPDTPIHINKLNIPKQGMINLNGRNYLYDGWEGEYDENGYFTKFRFTNMTMLNQANMEVEAEFPATGIVGNIAQIGEKNSTKGIPYYQARLNELVRTFSKYMNDLTTSGVDENGVDGLDAFTAEMVDGNDFVLKGTMQDGLAGTMTATASSYYRLTSLNWELNQQWKLDPSRIVVSYAEDVAQGNVEARPIVEKMMYGLTDQSMFQQGTMAQFMQAFTTNMAVDIYKNELFSANQDDIRYTIDNHRNSISGVDKNEEASDLTKFQNLYNLASKVISVLNEVYDKLINETGL